MAEYYMFNKPVGCITARRDERHKTVMDYFPEEKRDVLFPVGRLDGDTEGFLLVTDDGELCYKLLRPEHHIPKTYFFIATGALGDEKIALLEGGVKIYKNSDLITSPAKIEDVRALTYKDIAEHLPEKERRMSERRASLPAVSAFITITEGKKHQVRRMLRHVGCKIVYLKRVKMGELSLDAGLPLGKYRSLTAEELEILRR
ncbi:MAG: pseudouridine synthase [Clostridia bacterium]|nr:pseudouridine synthase [Clostridia bacterium]